VANRSRELYEEHALNVEKFFDERSPALNRFLRRINADRPHIVEDLLQETLLRVWLHIDNVPADEGHIQAWLFTIARNVSVDEARKRNRRPRESGGDYDIVNHSAPADPMEVVIAHETMLEAYRNLPTERRKALDEIYLKSRSPRDAANRLSVPEGTAKSRAFYALKSVRSAVFAK
jgi:RNA polymerase sigma-70 factor (ECF subfamily)